VPDLATNVLYYGDNLDILRRYLPDAAVDLVYLDPPFNSNRDYNVIFRDESGNATDAQLLAFEDTWHWGVRWWAGITRPMTGEPRLNRSRGCPTQACHKRPGWAKVPR
jgi:DNA modification methylase